MNQADVIETLSNYICEANALDEDALPLPLHESLLELGILDSFAVIELVSFIEKNWGIQIQDDELTKERFGSITKMADLVLEKVAKPQGQNIEP